MTAVQLPGSCSDALTHLAMVGSASIVAEACSSSPTLWWDEQLRPWVDYTCSVDEVAAILHTHAEERTDPESWVMRTHQHEGRETGTFSPRIKVPSGEESWRFLADARRAGLDRELAMRHFLDLAFIQALGEPAAWRHHRGQPRPDEGASRWEMTPRQTGREFVTNRLQKLARAVAGRAIGDARGALLGDVVIDEAGVRPLENSRSAAGFRGPGMTDNVLAWCAIWGLARLPLVPKVTHRSASSGFVPPSAVRPFGSMVLPVPRRATTLGRWERVARSKALVDVAEQATGAHGFELSGSASQLVAWGLGAAVIFDVDVDERTTARERHLRSGRCLPLLVD